MTKYREILRLKSLGISEREIATSCSVSRNTVARVCKRAAELNIQWPLDPSGKSYLAKAIGIQACQQFSVEYHTCEDLLSDLAELKKSNYEKYTRKIKHLTRLDLLILDDFLLHTIDDEGELKVLHSILDKRVDCKSTIVCSQRSPQGWASMMLNDEVSSNAITKRVTKHYTVLINPKT